MTCVNMCMQRTHASPSTHRSELPRQLQLVGDILKPFLTLKTEAALQEKYFAVRRKLWPEDNGRYWHFWRDLSLMFVEKVANVIYAHYDQYHEKVIAENRKAATLDKEHYAYHKQLLEMAFAIQDELHHLQEHEALLTDERETIYEEDSANELAGLFLHFILFLYAVRQPEEDGALEKGNADFAWRLGPCKTYQDNTEFMATVRDLSVLFIFVADDEWDAYTLNPNIHLSAYVLAVCQRYAQLARDDMKAHIFERGLLNKIRHNEHTLTEDTVELITDKTRGKSKAAMLSLLCRLRDVK